MRQRAQLLPQEVHQQVLLLLRQLQMEVRLLLLIRQDQALEDLLEL